MNAKNLSRRQLLKGSGALVVSFSLYGPLSRALAQSDGTPQARPYAAERIDLGTFTPEVGDYLDPQELDSWLAVLPDGSITMFTGKVDIGTGTRTALAQIVADELDVPFSRVTMAMGDTTKTVDQGRTVGSSTIPRGGRLPPWVALPHPRGPRPRALRRRGCGGPPARPGRRP